MIVNPFLIAALFFAFAAIGFLIGLALNLDAAWHDGVTHGRRVGSDEPEGDWDPTREGYGW